MAFIKLLVGNMCFAVMPASLSWDAVQWWSEAGITQPGGADDVIERCDGAMLRAIGHPYSLYTHFSFL
jgi:hypothetical protein